MTKICSKCGKEKPIEEFAFRDKKKGTRRAECKQCICERQKAKYYANKAVIEEIKSQQVCKKCGENRPYVLDFHHLNPDEKINTIARLSVHSSLTNALNEIDKCICLCANCHREFHYLEKTQHITIEQYLI